MLNQLEKAKASWGGKSSTIDNWLNERQQLLIQYCHLAGLDNQKSTALPHEAEISEFCTILMDYLSTGHFEVYDMLVEDDDAGMALKQRLYPLITTTTDKALDFNDTFAEGITHANEGQFDAALDGLGEVLEERFELEDELIQHMYNSMASVQTVE